ncbi:YccF domain-containing protein [Serinibacter arcticus]|uniref:YccF domain-containing protein n=1 Tax=Serinibacter arcticus TaxID=1655435 RepID=A0A2U1ZXH6_9MICO|nr:YccF domain-containing protein [Serinibacter arcticus]PWD51622.1 YccF domain-containing protein [Serinibacter arcticus]
MRGLLRFVLNVIWLILAGLPLALAYLLAGVICCILIVTIPWGIASFRIASYVLWPFGRTVVQRPTAGLGSAVGNVIWILVAGIWLVIGHIASAAALAVTIIGIPLAIAEIKIIPITLTPLGRQIVPSDTVFASYGNAGHV